MADAGPLTVTSMQLAEIMGVDIRTVQLMTEKDGVLAPAKIKRGQYEFLKALKLAFTHYRETAAKWKNRDGTVDTVEEAGLMRRAQRQLKELELQREQGKLISVEDLHAVMADHIKGLRAMVLAFPMEAQAEMPHLTAFDLETLRKVANKILMNNAVRMIEVDGVPPELTEKVQGRINKIQTDDD